MKFYQLILLAIFATAFSCAKRVTIITPENASVRLVFGVEKLTATLEEAGYEVQQSHSFTGNVKGLTFVVGEFESDLIKSISQKNGINLGQKPGKEGFMIKSSKDLVVIAGADASGALYACMKAADWIKEKKELSTNISFTDQPEMVLRGSCIGMQKTAYLPGRTVYEYPYTQENFPWFYDKQLWIKYLDMMVENRMNSLYLWNGHPFASLVKLDEYPYALEVDEETFKKNEEMFRFLAEEGNKRGIWIIQMFYNIIVSKPFAEHHGIKTQDRGRPITPLLADYTQKSITAFIQKYPNVGLLVCLGEAMDTHEDDVQWFTETIIPGVKDGLKALGINEEPPIILRAHDTNAKMVMDKALPLYKNLYTMHKYNGESLTTYQPRGPWTKIHTDLSSLGSIHISNVHILANLEPFRYGSPDFIQKSVSAMHNTHGANALHLYPQASYWDWPYTADNTPQRILEMDRDWIWYKAWARYAWKVKRDRNEEIEYWSNQLNDKYGAGEFSTDILTAYEQTGEIAPKTLRKFGITEGNRQTLLLGMFMSQLVNPHKWRVYPGFYESCGPEGEILIDWAKKEWNKEPHIGETPPHLIAEIREHGKMALESIERAAPHVKKDKDEFERLRNDVKAYKAFADCFAEKGEAAILVLRYNYSKDISDLEKALPHLEKSVEVYRHLVNLTKDTYLYANSMQTGQRRIPIGGNDGKNKTWEELLPHFEKELANFKKNLDLLKLSSSGSLKKTINAKFLPAQVKVLNKDVKNFKLVKGQKLFGGKDYVVTDFAEELKDLSGLYIPVEKQQEEGTKLDFETGKPVQVVIGYFNTDSKGYLMPPTLETDASANSRGQAETLIANAIDIEGLPRVNIHTYLFEAGKHSLSLGKGAVLILGFADASQKVSQREAGYGLGGDESVDWLFY